MSLFWSIAVVGAALHSKIQLLGRSSVNAMHLLNTQTIRQYCFLTPIGEGLGMDLAEASKITKKQRRPRRSTSTSTPLNPDMLSTILELSRPSIVSLLTKRPSLRSAHPDNIGETMKVLKKYGFDSKSIQQNPDLLLMTPHAAENYIIIFQETGFKLVKPHLVLSYRELTKQSIAVLRSADLLPTGKDVIQGYIELLNLSQKYQKMLWSSLGKDYEHISVSEVRLTCLLHFLMYKFNCDLATGNKIVKTYPRLKNRSFKWINENLQILTDKLQFPLDKIRKHCYLLQTNPANSLEILEKVPEIAGKPLSEVISLRPKILMSQFSSLLEIQNSFKQHGITSEAITKYPEIYTLSPLTIRERLEEFNRIPEFSIMKSHPRVGRLIYYQNKVKKRLEYLQNTHQVFNTSLHILSADTAHFEQHLKHGEMRNRGVDNVQFISSYLNLSKSFVRESMNLHPHWKDVPLVSVQSVINYLTMTKSFTMEQIKYGLQVMLYPIDKVKSCMRFVVETNEAVENDLHFLQMVLYFLEKEVHFTGAGIWNNQTPSSDDSQESDNHSVQDAELERTAELDGSRENVLTQSQSFEHRNRRGRNNHQIGESVNPFNEFGMLDYEKLELMQQWEERDGDSLLTLKNVPTHFLLDDDMDFHRL